MSAETMIEVSDLVKHYPVRGEEQPVRAVDGISFAVSRGRTLGIVGESGCGKSTTARLLTRLEEPTSGRVLIGGEDLAEARGKQLARLRRRIQLVFQDPHSALNPRLSVADTLGEVLRVHRLAAGRAAVEDRVTELLELVGMTRSFLDRYPHELSGGQRQRIGVARALAVEPEVLVLDEPLSALDISVQAEVMNLLVRLRDQLDLTYVFISHDLGMVRYLADEVAVMYLGRVVELAPGAVLAGGSRHPYTAALRDAVPVADPTTEAGRLPAPLPGDVPDPADPPTGCRFHPRCPIAEPACSETDPQLLTLAADHLGACLVAQREVGAGPGTGPGA